jgi:subtilisin family serine protease
VGSLSSFSSRGPTRDGRTAPTLAAPGQAVMSALVGATGTAQYQSMSGTSMAAPHITGAIALMLQATPSLAQPAIVDCLTSTARSDAQTGAVPNNAWGAGKMDAAAAVGCAAPAPPRPFTHQLTLPPLTRPPGPGPGPAGGGPGGPVLPFVRFAGALLDPSSLFLRRVPELAGSADALAGVGIERLDQLATTSPDDLAAAGHELSEAEHLVAYAQSLLRALAGS